MQMEVIIVKVDHMQTQHTIYMIICNRDVKAEWREGKGGWSKRGTEG